MLDIVVPVYNEANCIKKLFDEIEREIRTPKRVMVVYDFEEDSTIPVVINCRHEYSFCIDLMHNTIGRGVVNAIKYGMEMATNEMVLIMMADLSDKLDVVDSMCELMSSGYDLVCGSRYMKGGKQNGGPLFKGMLSRMAGLSLHVLTKVPTHDCTNSFKLYRKTMLDNLVIESTGGFEIGLEIVVKAYASGYRIGEVPSEWFDREEGESNFHLWKWMPHYLHWYFYCIWHTWTRSIKRRRQ